ncbi:PA2BB Phospholipase, partial [Spelaeornis formosus]|nr:PA2BB Phospholipase [Elachura formosa]
LGLASCHWAQLRKMVKEKTGKSALAYIGYGCHCGSAGTKQPVDATDRCCHAHVCCYNKLESPRCNPYTATYKYFFVGNRIICGSGNPCETRACACDREFAECLQRAASTYHKSYLNYPKSKCKGKEPSC